eukprot:m.73874 g.73874  ORF g.73874 m.73874 type:complete len:385 (+) comp20380_c0_seq2:42-1196(+)
MQSLFLYVLVLRTVALASNQPEVLDALPNPEGDEVLHHHRYTDPDAEPTHSHVTDKFQGNILIDSSVQVDDDVEIFGRVDVDQGEVPPTDASDSATNDESNAVPNSSQKRVKPIQVVPDVHDDSDDMLHTAALIDREYRIRNLGSPNLKKHIAECQAAIAEKGLCVLPNFLREGGVKQMMLDLTQQVPVSRPHYHNVFQTPKNDSLPENHPVNRELYASIGFISRQLLLGSRIEKLYVWKPFVDFVSAITQTPIYLSKDPKGSAYATVNAEGQVTSWHFDQSPFAVGFLLHEPVDGGLFQWVPHSREGGEEATLQRVTDLLDGTLQPEALSIKTGSFYIFQGNVTLHQVSPVEGINHRVSVIFTYDTEEKSFQHTNLVNDNNGW